MPLIGGQWLRACLVALTGFGLICGTTLAATPEEVDKAIKKAVDYLYSQQHNGNWEKAQSRQGMENTAVVGAQWGGLTAIAVYGLLAAGENPRNNPKLEAAVHFLENADIVGNYATGLRCQAWEMLPQTKENQALLQRLILRDAVALQYNSPVFKGLYTYVNGIVADQGSGDKSNSQYGVLGVWACEQAGLEVPDQYWKTVEKAWLTSQNNDGGWGYTYYGGKPFTPTRASLAAAGVATLFIAYDYLYGSQGVDCRSTGRNPTYDAIEKGLDYMSKHFNEVDDLYTWYGVERIGTASGYKYFGTVDWYKQGSDLLVKNQAADGSWNSVSPTDHGHGTIPGTAWGIVFLVRGRAPVVMNKLEYAIDTHGDRKIDANWNQRPRDAANITRWIGKELERDLNWQIVNLNVDIDGLHDSPILYISGNQSLNFSEDQIKKLRQFVEDGGLILGNANCGKDAFAKSFKALGNKLFPDYEFRLLGKDHPIFADEQFVYSPKWKTLPKLEGLSNGARELMLLFPNDDPSQYWQTRAYGAHEEMFKTMTNIFLYAAGKRNLRTKGDTYIVRRKDKNPASKSLKVARLQYAGNWNPEPAGWSRLDAVLHNGHDLDLDVQSVELGKGKLDGFKVAHMTGTTSINNLTDAQKKELKDFVDKGGTLIVDATGGNGQFAASAQTQLEQIFGHADQLLKPLPADSPALAGGDKSLRIRYRDFARKTLGGMSGPDIRAITVNGRPAVFFSPVDISAGLVGEPIDGIVGYEPASATELMSNILLYVANGFKAPPSTGAGATTK